MDPCLEDVLTFLAFGAPVDGEDSSHRRSNHLARGPAARRKKLQQPGVAMQPSESTCALLLYDLKNLLRVSSLNPLCSLPPSYNDTIRVIPLQFRFVLCIKRYTLKASPASTWTIARGMPLRTPSCQQS